MELANIIKLVLMTWKLEVQIFHPTYYPKNKSTNKTQ